MSKKDKKVSLTVTLTEEAYALLRAAGTIYGLKPKAYLKLIATQCALEDLERLGNVISCDYAKEECCGKEDCCCEDKKECCCKDEKSDCCCGEKKECCCKEEKAECSEENQECCKAEEEKPCCSEEKVPEAPAAEAEPVPEAAPAQPAEKHVRPTMKRRSRKAGR